MDWSDEVEARLEKYPQAGGGTSEQHESDVRCAVREIGWQRAQLVGMYERIIPDEIAKALRSRDEADKKNRMQLAELKGKIALWERALPNTAEHVAELERLRAVVKAGLELTRSWSDVSTHSWRNKARSSLS